MKTQNIPPQLKKKKTNTNPIKTHMPSRKSVLLFIKQSLNQRGYRDM